MDVTFTYHKNSSALEELAKSAGAGKISGEAVDIRDSTACANLAEKVFDRAGKIDLLVNNAGIIRDNPLTALEDEDVRAVIDTNVIGAFNMTRAIAPYMVSQRRGKIINISSVAGEKGGRGQTNYAASKGALNAFTRALAVELAPRNITVNAVAPGVIETEMSREVRERAGDQVTSRILLRRIGKPEEIANAVWFLASRLSDYVTGQVLHVDGGFKME
jgi:3-oxoacyl-[acyl-carrier protein] reductase